MILSQIKTCVHQQTFSCFSKNMQENSTVNGFPQIAQIFAEGIDYPFFPVLYLTSLHLISPYL